MVFLGGGLGSLARYGTGKAVLQVYSGSFPVGTLLANLISCVVLGVLVWMVAQQRISEQWAAFAVIGFCGGFSTFSTFSYETLKLAQDGAWMFVFLNVLVSIAAGIAAIYLVQRSL